MDKENQPIALSTLTREQLTRYIQELISNDFPKLVQVLYRLDISEAKLKQTLASQPDKDAGELITQMIIERQEAKKASRELFRGKDWGGSEEERW